MSYVCKNIESVTFVCFCNDSFSMCHIASLMCGLGLETCALGLGLVYITGFVIFNCDRMCLRSFVLHFIRHIICCIVVQWCSGRALDLQSLDRGFDSHRWPLRTLGKLFTPMCLCHQAV